jgi:hypothetical protein
MVPFQNKLDNVLGNAARPFKYKVEISFPQKLNASNILETGTLDMLVKATQLPSTINNPVIFTADGHDYLLPGEMSYDRNWNATFYLDDSYYAKHLMEYWMLMINSYYSEYNETSVSKAGSATVPGMGILQNTAIELGSKALTAVTDTLFGSGNMASSFIKRVLKGIVNTNDFYGEVKISQLNYMNDIICTYTLKNAFPILVSNVQFNNENISGISEFDVSFAYSHYHYGTPTDIIGGLVNNIDNTIAGSVSNTVSGFFK